MLVNCESLHVGDKVLACKHEGLVNGTVTKVGEVFAHIFEVEVVGGKTINPHGKLKVLIMLNTEFEVERLNPDA